MLNSLLGNDMNLNHYFIENQKSEPFDHRSYIRLSDSGIGKLVLQFKILPIDGMKLQSPTKISCIFYICRKF